MTTEFLMGQPLSADDLEMIRKQIESMDSIGVISEEIRGIVARNWPHLLSKLPPDDLGQVPGAEAKKGNQ